MLQITGSNYNNSELDVVWVKQPDGTFKQSYDYYGQPASDYEFTGYLGAKTYKYDSGSYVFNDLMLKMRFTKRTLQWPPMIGGEGSSYYGWGMPNALFNYMYNLEKGCT